MAHAQQFLDLAALAASGLCADIAEIVALLKQMADSGVTLDRADDAVKAIFEFIGLPVPEVDPMADAARRDDAARRAGLGPRAAPTDDGSIDVNLDEET